MLNSFKLGYIDIPKALKSEQSIILFVISLVENPLNFSINDAIFSINLHNCWISFNFSGTFHFNPKDLTLRFVQTYFHKDNNLYQQ